MDTITVTASTGGIFEQREYSSLDSGRLYSDLGVDPSITAIVQAWVQQPTKRLRKGNMVTGARVMLQLAHTLEIKDHCGVRYTFSLG